FSFTFRDSALNASYHFAATKPPEQRRIYEGSLTGPVGRSKKDSFLVSIQRQDEDLESIVFAQGLSGPIQANIATPQRTTEVSGKLSHIFSDKHNMAFTYSLEQYDNKNQGVGGTVLASAGTRGHGHEQQWGFTDTKIISPSL